MEVVRRTRPPAMATGQEMRWTPMMDHENGDQLGGRHVLGSQSGSWPPSSDESSLMSAILMS